MSILKSTKSGTQISFDFEYLKKHDNFSNTYRDFWEHAKDYKYFSFKCDEHKIEYRFEKGFFITEKYGVFGYRIFIRTIGDFFLIRSYWKALENPEICNCFSDRENLTKRLCKRIENEQFISVTNAYKD